ncbi:hypothetical protein MFLAVUS_003577 [Mucor flavus]|uniref:Nitrogen regulatory protein areA GATA-like domain-containing protein n=1 Tax=Mucor flavus TaxID=439312 RepID=A0ABP9YTG3_9FUNG
MVSVTAATAATIKKPVAEDDFESQQKRNVRQPEMCVDYLSYTFDEMDLAASWRVMTKQKKDVVDGIRLENASWRTWAKQRNNLKTISPQTLNWLKDSDVTWLYGPLHTVIRTEDDPFLTPRKSTAEETLGLMIPRHTQKSVNSHPPLKSALKKVTTADLLKRSASELMDITSDQHRRSVSISEANNELHAVSPNILATYRQPRLRFNHQVEQCIALTDEEREHEDIEEEEDEDDLIHDHDHEDEDDDDEDDSDDDNDQIHITYYNERRKSIKKIAPARLKKSQSDADTDDVSSISSTSTASSVGFITRSPVVSSPAAGQFEDTDEDEVLSFYDRPTAAQQSTTRPTTIRPSSSSNSITQPYKEKTNIAEPALVTMHQTATDIQKDSGANSPTLINNIAHWAASYLWPGDNNRSKPSPRPSVSASIIPTSAIPTQRHYAPTSSNSSSL